MEYGRLGIVKPTFEILVFKDSESITISTQPRQLGQNRSQHSEQKTAGVGEVVAVCLSQSNL